MRTHLLSALAIVCGAEVACGQTMSAYPTNGYYQGYGAGYQANPAWNRYYGYGSYPNVRPAGYGGYYPGYATYAGYPGNYNYPNYMNRAANNYYYNTAPQPAAAPTSTMTEALPPALPETAAAPEAVSLPEAPLEHPPEASSFPPGVDCAPPMAVAAPAKANPKRLWVTSEYMLSILRPQRLTSPLVTTGSQLGLRPGAIDDPGTAVLFGDSINTGLFSGVRSSIGVFLDEGNRFSLEGSGFYAFQNSVHFGKTSDEMGNPIIARPVFDVLTNDERALVDARPNVDAGGISVEAQTQFWGAELDLNYHLRPAARLGVDGIFGFRFARLVEDLAIRDVYRPLFDNTLTFQGPGNFVNAPNFLMDEDRFHTGNNFYGLQLGGRIHWDTQWYSVGAFGKVAAGVTDQSADVNGSTTLITPTDTITAAGGVLALPSNIGHYNRTIFGIVPEVGLNFGVNISPNLQLTAGYSFLYWNQVARPAEQIDHVVNTSMIPSSPNFALATGTSRPVFHFAEEAFWLHAFTFGVDFHY